MLPIVLASTSPYRRELLQRLKLEFQCAAPNTSEEQLEGESAPEMVQRLALAKAESLAIHHPQALLIGSDQVACLDGNILGKPGVHQNAIAQLTACSGKQVEFHTGLCLLNTAENSRQIDDVIFTVEFRGLEPTEIERYLEAEKPYDCAGSFKSEGQGISLFKRLLGDDPTALMGLPLIRLCEMLRLTGMKIP